ncbi:MAG TPA: BON domain-containing protein [Candidatus Binatia bacterium]|nr:BON domain-containing protein [Candidatus Binatia bacterium]
MNPRNLLFIIFAFGGVIALIAGRASRTFPEAQAAAFPPGPGSPSAANAKLEEAVRTMFDGDEQVRDAKLSVQADITKNEVTLSGTVDSESVRSKAVELAKTAHAGVVVNDKIAVRPRKPTAVH